MYSTEHLEIGYKIGSHYEIQKVLGQGGFGIVYLVKDKHQLEKILVVKELFSKEFSFRNRDSNAVSNKTKSQNIFKKIKEGIVREVKILSKIKNSNIVEAYGYLEENNTIYSIMEYIEGIDLGRYTEDKGVFNEDEARNLLKQLINGLKEIHNKNIIHRDVKPNNIMRTPEGVYKLIDFSTNKTYTDDSVTAITGFTNHIFTSPELQETRAVVGKFSDIYSIGMTLLKVLSLEEELPNLTDRLTDKSKNDNKFYHYIDILNISEEFKSIIKKMTSLSKEDRYQSLEEIEEGLKIEPKEEIEEVLKIESKEEIEEGLKIEPKIEEKKRSINSVETEIYFEEEREIAEPVERRFIGPKSKPLVMPKKTIFTIEKAIKVLTGITIVLSVVLLVVFILQ